MYVITIAVANPGFPLGGVDLVGGGIDSRGSYISKIVYVEMKESGPLGVERAPGTPLDPTMNRVLVIFFVKFMSCCHLIKPYFPKAVRRYEHHNIFLLCRQ